MGAKRVCFMTDANLVKLPAVKTATEALHKAGVEFDLFDAVRVEPSDKR